MGARRKKASGFPPAIQIGGRADPEEASGAGLSLYLHIVYNCEGGQESVRRERPA